jgi:hypothetical protein
MIIKVMYLFFILILISGCGAGNNKRFDKLQSDMENIKYRKIKETQELQNKIALLEYNERKKTCSPIYNLYKKCYGIGIINSSNEQCLRAGVAAFQMLKTSIGKTMGRLCMMACKTAASNEGMLSYNKFDSKICKSK